jgi:hypothetical protein
MYKAIKVLNRKTWFRSIRPGDVSKGQFKDYNALKSISVQLAGYNASEGKKYGVYIHAKYLSSELCVILVGVTLKQRKRELEDPDCKDEWRKLIKE